MQGVYLLDDWLKTFSLEKSLSAYWGTKPLTFGGVTYDAPARQRVEEACRALNFPQVPVIPKQCHGKRVVWLDADTPDRDTLTQDTDGLLTTVPELPIGVLTADCVPVLLACRHGRFVGAVHAGWRGVAANIVPEALLCLQARFPDALETLCVYLGVSAQEGFYRVDKPVIDALHKTLQENAMASSDLVTPWFRIAEPEEPQTFYVSLHQVLQRQLIMRGVPEHCIYRTTQCSIDPATQATTWSHRRGEQSRMVHALWLHPTSC